MAAFFAHIRNFRRDFAEAWACPRRGLAIRFVLMIMFFAISTVGFVGIRLMKHAEARLANIQGGHGHGEHSKAPASEHGGSAEGGEHGAQSEHGDTASGGAGMVFMNAIPDAIEKRRDGKEEADKDLKEPDDSGRLPSSISGEQKTVPYNPFFKITGIVTTTADQGTQLARVAATITLEVDSSEAMRELEKKQGELKYMIASLISEQSSTLLRKPDGKAKLKNDVFKEVNYHLRNGKIRDVLIEELIIQ